MESGVQGLLSTVSVLSQAHSVLAFFPHPVCTTATAAQAWTTLAKDRPQWQTLEKAFINFTLPQITTRHTNDQHNGSNTTTP